MSVISWSSDDDWEDNFSLMDADSIGHGGSSSVFAIDQNRVLKAFPGDEDGEKDFERETSIYEKIQLAGGSNHIVKYHKTWGSGIVLERHVKTLRQDLKMRPNGNHPSCAKRWIKELCDGLDFLHRNDIWHSDLGCHNVLLDREGHLKICDFAGSRFWNGKSWEDSWVAYEVRSHHPKYYYRQPDVTAELFALGSMIFEIWTSRPPYVSEPEPIVRRKFLEGEFPLSMIEDDNIQLIVNRCWTGNYRRVAQICDQLKTI